MPPPAIPSSFPTVLPRAQSTAFVAIPSVYGNQDDSPSPGIVVGIVLGSVGGVLVVLFLLYSALGFGPMVLFGSSSSMVEVADARGTSSVRTKRRRSSGRGHHQPVATEMYEVRTRVPAAAAAAPVVVEGVGVGAGRTTRTSTRTRTTTTAAPPPRVDSSDDDDDEDDDDEVVVIEEHTPPRRDRRRRSDDRRSSREYREVRRESTRRYSRDDRR